MNSQEDFLKNLINLNEFHRKNCAFFSRYLSRYFGDGFITELSDLPYLPVQFFKYFDLLSVPPSDIVKTMYSSGTGGHRSKIHLDKHNALNQTKVLGKLGRSVLGSIRRPMVVLARKEKTVLRNGFSAQVAGINGFRAFSNAIYFLFESDGSLCEDTIREIENYKKVGVKPFLFGFTSILWNDVQGIDLPISRPFDGCTLIHGGGWKKLESLGISNNVFESQICAKLGNLKIVNYYGMIEQVGSIFFQCENHFFHDSDVGKILIRDIHSWELCPDGKVGLIHCLSELPTSYPGHSLLTEDLGVRYSGTCECGSSMPRFKVLGRAEKAEVRGCSDAV